MLEGGHRVVALKAIEGGPQFGSQPRGGVGEDAMDSGADVGRVLGRLERLFLEVLEEPVPLSLGQRKALTKIR